MSRREIKEKHMYDGKKRPEENKNNKPKIELSQKQMESSSQNKFKNPVMGFGLKSHFGVSSQPNINAQTNLKIDLSKVNDELEEPHTSEPTSKFKVDEKERRLNDLCPDDQ
jgi:hypothetical protein